MPHSVLLIEAGPGSSANVRRVLDELELEVTTVDSCRSSHALLAAADGFRLALVDSRAPEGAHGDEDCGLRCEHLQASRLPFAVMSERSDREFVRASLEAGALCFVPKAAGPEFIAPVIAAAVARAADLRALGDSVARMAEMVKSRRLMQLATGIIMERFSLNDSDASRLLRYFARSHRITLEEAADKVMSKGGSLELFAVAHRFAQRFAP